MSSRIVFGSSRAGGHDWTSYFPSIAEAAIQLGPATTILDGEAVVLNDKGVPNFGMLQRALVDARQHAPPMRPFSTPLPFSISTDMT
jgi:ATP-dependent DNA ligase